MATHTGSEGTVKVGANAIAEIRSYSLEDTADTVEDTSMGDTYRTHIGVYGRGICEFRGTRFSKPQWTINTEWNRCPLHNDRYRCPITNHVSVHNRPKL